MSSPWLDIIAAAPGWLTDRGELVIPLILAGWIAVGDIRTRRIPNYLTLGGALAGLGFRWGFHGWPGLVDGFLGLLLGFSLLILLYVKGGMGAGDVKALAALGAWLGPRLTFHLFLYMALCGGVIILGILWWRGLLWLKIRQGWVLLVNWLLFRPYGPGSLPLSPAETTPGFPYGVAMALGMIVLFWLAP